MAARFLSLIVLPGCGHRREHARTPASEKRYYIWDADPVTCPVVVNAEGDKA